MGGSWRNPEYDPELANALAPIVAAANPARTDPLIARLKIRFGDNEVDRAQLNMWNGELIISGLSMCWVFHTLHELFNLAGRKTCLVMRPRNRGCETSTQQEPLLDMEAVQKEADRSGRRKSFRLERVGNPIDMRMRSPSPLRREVDCTSASRSTVCTPSQSPFIQLPINPCFRQRHERTPPPL